VDSDHRVIVAVGVSNQPPDVEHLEPMLQRIATSAGALPEVMTLDAGYWSVENAKACADKGIDAYIATGRLLHGQPSPPRRGPMPRNADAKTRMARKLRSKKGSGIKDLRPAQGNCGAGERADQGRPGPAALLAAGTGEGRWRVAPDRGHPQPAQAVQAQAITAADAVGSHRMRGYGLGGVSQGCIGRRPRAQPAVDQLSSGIRRVRRAAALSATNS
jgi:hypothetical protein